jgi:hypothetical protein
MEFPDLLQESAHRLGTDGDHQQAGLSDSALQVGLGGDSVLSFELPQLAGMPVMDHYRPTVSSEAQAGE